VRGKNRVEYTGASCNVCWTSERYVIWWRSEMYQHLSRYQSCNATNTMTVQYSAVISFNAPGLIYSHIQGVSGGKVNILGRHVIGHSKQKCLYVHVSYSERFPR
jgi:hypothetical protein